ncbi:hypothetical protein Tco_0816967 [Tanacetum coccineum]
MERVRGSGYGDRIDQNMGSVFRVGRKSPPKNFSGGGAVVAGDIRPIYDEEPMAEVQTTAEINILLQDNSILSNLNSIMKEKGHSPLATKVESETPNGSNADITNQGESIQALYVKCRAPFLNVQMTSVHISSGLVLHQMTSDHNRSELGIHDHSNEPSSSEAVTTVVPLAVRRYITTRDGIYYSTFT